MTQPDSEERADADSAADEPGAPTPRSVRARRVVFAVLALGVAALFAWSPGGSGSGPSPMAGGEGPGATTVSVGEAAREDLTERSTYPGELAADRADLASKIGGRILEVAVRTGDAVERGDVVARLDASDLRAQLREAQAQLESAASSARRARVELEAAERDLERSERLAERDVVSAQDVDEARDRVGTLREEVQAARAERARAEAQIQVLRQDVSEAEIVAPFDGTVSERYVDPGAFVQGGAEVVRLVATDPLRVVFEVPERDVGDFGQGATFDVRAPPTGAETFTGVVTGAAREVERERRIARVEGTIEGPPESWLAGMYAEVVTPVRVHEDAVVVPEPALLSRVDPGGQTFYGVFRPDDGRARWIEVTVLGRDDGRAAVEGDIGEGDRVLVGGHRELGDGEPISIYGAEGESAAGRGGEPVTGDDRPGGPVAEDDDGAEDEGGADGEGGA